MLRACDPISRIRWLSLALAVLAIPASASEVQVKGGRRTLKIVGEPRTTYHPFGVGRPIEARVVGPAKVELGFRVQVPETGEGRAKVRVLLNGSEFMTVKLEGAGAGRFQGHHPTAPGPLVSRSLEIGEGPHEITLEALGGSAVVSVRAIHPSLDALALAPLTATPLEAAPLEAAPLAPPPRPSLDALALAPLTPAPLTPPHPVAEESPSANADQILAPPPVVETPAPPPTGAVESRRSGSSSLHFYLLGGGALVGAGAVTAYLLSVGANGEYRQTPEVRSSAPTNRSQILARANSELAWSQGLGLVAVALLASSAISWSF